LKCIAETIAATSQFYELIWAAFHWFFFFRFSLACVSQSHIGEFNFLVLSRLSGLGQSNLWWMQKCPSPFGP
jgi:hypothetical protein